MSKSKILAAVAAFALVASGAFATTGTFGSYINIDGTWYGAAQPGPTTTTAFDGNDFGTVASLTINDASLLTFKNGTPDAATGTDVTGAFVEWRVYSGAPGAFSPEGISFGENATLTDPLGNSFSNSGDQEWTGSPSGIDVANGLGAGAYSFEIFFRQTNNGSGDVVDNNAGANYIGTFTVVPEPATMALFGMGLAGLFVSRRRRA